MIRLTFLGTGTSHGVPTLDCLRTDYQICPQGVCLAAQHDPRHARTRCSIFLESEATHLLIDTSLDFRAQMLAQQVKQIDKVLFTHNHADHVGGLADIRSYCLPGQPMPIYGSEETLTTLQERYDYIFNPPPIQGGGIPELTLHVLADGEPVMLGDFPVTPARVVHGSATGCFGYRIGPIAYIPDIKEMPERAREIFYGADVLILNALRRAPEHSTHLTLPESVNLARELNPKTCYFTHLSHDIHYELDGVDLPENMSFAYDGLRLEV